MEITHTVCTYCRNLFINFPLFEHANECPYSWQSADWMQKEWQRMIDWKSALQEWHTNLPLVKWQCTFSCPSLSLRETHSCQFLYKHWFQTLVL